MRKLALIILVLSGGLHLQAQDKKVKIISKSSMAPDPAYSLIDKAEKIAVKDPAKAIDYIQEALTLNLKEGDKKIEGLCYKLLGEINTNQGIYSKGQENFLKALDIFRNLQESDLVNKTLIGLSLSYENGNNIKEAIEINNQLIKDASGKSNKREQVKWRYKNGDLYLLLGNFQQALAEYTAALSIEEKDKNKEGIIDANNRIGKVYLEQEKNNKAIQHYKKLEEIAEESKDEKTKADMYSNISRAYSNQNRLDDALIAKQKSLEANKKLDDKEALAKEYVDVGNLYLEQKNSANAVPYIEKGIQLSEESGDLIKKADGLKALSKAYKESGNIMKSMALYEEYVSLKDSILSKKEHELNHLLYGKDDLISRQKKLEILEKDMALNQKTIDLLRKDQKIREAGLKRQQLIIYGLLSGLLLVFGSSWVVFASSRKRRISNQQLALKSLSSQMNPHFIFNALNSVNNFIAKNDERSANKYLSDFSKLMRAVMENSQHDFVPMATEIRILELYLQLEHSRFPDKFDYTFEIDESINREIEIPPMLIQPYIENAVWHGLRYKEDKGFLKVKVSQVQSGIEVVIEDNGIGRKKSKELKTQNQKESSSLGMKNIESRLGIINELYKIQMKVVIEDLDAANQSGTKVIITIGTK
ncbi:tetratricopeptide repeat-containing sensor histidine kinase [Sporocytophaga myxococcoides]|uniref:tetratricopeptide repeat-containing sensor histidine kinase n=1 Tax=Sporocytophaga myxococcoides TaxID=153721 RepID=UPI000491D5D1|nr:tetratricopeptide repeat protein [Sporocytophaga myxococcoides]